MTLLSVVFVLVNGSTTALMRFPLAGHPSYLTVAHRSLDMTGMWLEQMVGVAGLGRRRRAKLPASLIDGWELAVLAIVTGGTWPSVPGVSGLP